MVGRGAGYDRRGGSIRVMRLQRHLRRMGLRPGPIDGLYGPLTAAAVARFQRAQGTRVDGVAWPRTRRAIGNARAGAGTRVAGDGRTTTSRMVDDRAPSRQALDGTKARRSIRHAALDTGERPARIEEATDAGLIVLSGLLVVMLIAVAAPAARRVVMAPASATAGGAATPPADDPGPSPASAEPPLLPTAADHDTEPNWREADGRAVNAVGYLTAPDPTRGHVELRHQITAMDALCERSGWRLVEVARDVGDISGEALERPGLNYALERLAATDRPCLMVAELRRLGESAAELGRVLRWLRERGLRLIAVDVQLDTAAAEGRIAADALISVGARAEQGARTRRTEGEVRDPRPGRPAVRDLPELREHIVAMRSAGMTLQAIADRLNEERVPTMRGGREWRPSSVQVAAGYRRPRRLSSRRNAYDNRSAQRRRLEDR
jgi:DNA invertase Pin-like site-specific DNA recombinase